MDRIVSAQRARLAPYIERVNGAEMREGFREVFDRAAGRFALGAMDGTEFRGIVGELIRDASGTAFQQDRAAARASADGVRDVPDPDQPWATMPTDGSGRLGRAERVVYGVIGAACVIALLFMGWTLGVFGADSPDAPPAPALVSATVADTGPDVDMRDREMITRGAYWSWAAADGCARGPVECDRALREVNGEAALYGLHVWEDGSVSPR